MSVRLVFVAFIALILASTVIEAGKTEGKFNYAKRTCTWKEMGSKHSHDRTLKIACPGKKNVPQIKCFYEGDPHKCNWYSNKEVEYYTCLVEALKAAARNANSDTPCHANKVSCHKNGCGDVYFEKKQNMSIFKQIVYERIMKSMEFDYQ